MENQRSDGSISHASAHTDIRPPGNVKGVSQRLRSSRCSSSLSGHTLTEITISMAIAAFLASGFFSAFGGMSTNLQREVRIGLYQDSVRQALHHIARDVRLAGANPTGNADLFDKNPASDVALDLDPDKDGDITNGILARADRRGDQMNTPDGDTTDTLETVMYHYDKANARILRHTWRVVPADSGTESQDHQQNEEDYDVSPFVEGICSFSLSYLDIKGAATTDPELVASVLVAVTSASGPGLCHDTNSFTRPANVHIRIRNR